MTDELNGPGAILGRAAAARPDKTALVTATGSSSYAELHDLSDTGGYDIYPAELERVIAGHPDVATVAVGSVPDDVRGEPARAFVVAREGTHPSEDAILAHAREHLAAYEVPRSARFVSALPQTSTGRIMRRKLSETEPVER